MSNAIQRLERQGKSNQSNTFLFQLSKMIRQKITDTQVIAISHKIPTGRRNLTLGIQSFTRRVFPLAGLNTSNCTSLPQFFLSSTFTHQQLTNSICISLIISDITCCICNTFKHISTTLTSLSLASLSSVHKALTCSLSLHRSLVYRYVLM